MECFAHHNRRPVIIWLWSGAVLVFLMVILGGITRLTGSGLSMSDWNLIMGAIPPLNAEEWQQAFERYQQFPEYRQLNRGMNLREFKAIFYWEYLHRVLGRITGIVFLIPFLFFWIRGYFTPRLFKRLLLLFGLGTLQGAMGWIMVKSGLGDVPYVSHYRLTMHLLLAIVLIGLCAWFALDLGKEKQSGKAEHRTEKLKRWTWAVGVVFFVQVIWGAFTAGLHAGYIYNTFPLMNHNWLPKHALIMKPVIINFFENPGTVQWIHRSVGSLLVLAVAGLWIGTRFSEIQSSLKLKADVLLALIAVQYTFGILTLLHHVPVALGVTHQAGAVIFWVALLIYYHELRNSE